MLCEKCQKDLNHLSRSQKQNRLAHKWYRERDEATGNGSEYERALCKLHYGIPILREDSEEFREAYDSCLKTLGYEQKLNLIEVMDFPVTRLMGVKQMVRYLNEIDRQSAAQGIVLTHPEDLYWESLGVKAA